MRERDPVNADIERLNSEISNRLRADRIERWRSHVHQSDRRTDPRRHWSLLRGLSGKWAHVPPNQPIAFHGKCLSSPKSIANGFIRQYAPLPSSLKETRKVIRNIDRDHPLDHSFAPFTAEETAAAISASKNSTALGPDGLAPWHFKRLGPRAIQYLTSIFNLSVAHADVPSIWKTARIIPVLKPNKPADRGLSYRPVSLLCPAVKILERLIHPSLTEAFTLAPHQHGFRRRRSTVTALLPLADQIAAGFRQPKPHSRSVVVALDLSKAFERVEHTLLLKQVAASPLHSNLVRWLRSYLRGRTSFCEYQSTRSAFRRNHFGVPQGGVISPILFNYFVSDFPDCAEHVVNYADDYTLIASGVDIDEVEVRLNDDLALIADWARRKRLTLAPDKSTVTLFTADSHQYNYHPRIYLNGSLIPLERNPKILGVTWDPLLTFGPHARAVAGKVRSRLNILKALAGTDWGHSQEDLALTFRSLAMSLINYAAPIYSPNLKPSNINLIQRAQNQCL